MQELDDERVAARDEERQAKVNAEEPAYRHAKNLLNVGREKRGKDRAEAKRNAMTNLADDTTDMSAVSGQWSPPPNSPQIRELVRKQEESAEQRSRENEARRARDRPKRDRQLKQFGLDLEDDISECFHAADREAQARKIAAMGPVPPPRVERPIDRMIRGYDPLGLETWADKYDVYRLPLWPRRTTTRRSERPIDRLVRESEEFPQLRQTRPSIARAFLRFDELEGINEEDKWWHDRCRTIAKQYDDAAAEYDPLYRTAFDKVDDDKITDNKLDDDAERLDKESFHDATPIDHSEWERRIARRKMRMEEVEPAETHSTGILETLKHWATGAWNKVKSLWS